MALLLGYSIICFIEVFYFFIVRWIENCIDPTLNKYALQKANLTL